MAREIGSQAKKRIKKMINNFDLEKDFPEVFNFCNYMSGDVDDFVDTRENKESFLNNFRSFVGGKKIYRNNVEYFEYVVQEFKGCARKTFIFIPLNNGFNLVYGI